jgi:hypothetical protein
MLDVSFLGLTVVVDVSLAPLGSPIRALVSISELESPSGYEYLRVFIPPIRRRKQKNLTVLRIGMHDPLSVIRNGKDYL